MRWFDRFWRRRRPPSPPPPPPPPTSSDVVKAFDTVYGASAAWFADMFNHGFRLAIFSTNEWGQNKPWADAPAAIKRALDAGLMVAAYTRDPRWWHTGIQACAPYIDRLQFFCLDIETDPGVPVTRAMVDGVRALGVRPLIYSGWGMWPSIMHNSTAFADVPLWDVDAEGAHWPIGFGPTLDDPKPVTYGGWNTAANPRVGLQQTWDLIYQGINVDLSSFSAAFLSSSR